MSSPFPPPGVKVLSIGDLTRAVKGLLEEAFSPHVWVAGEVSNLKKHTSGHWYLTLKDRESQLQTVIFRGVNLRLRYDLHDGLEVIARGRMIVYQPRGQYQMEVEEVQPRGVGALELAFRQLKEKLSVRGFFEPERKQPLPRLPRRVAVVSSATGSAVRDVLEMLSRRWPAVEVWVCPVRVQGDGAREEIAAGLDRLNRLGGAMTRTPIDAIILARGGGSLEDLWPFNEEIVAEAIFRSRIPVVSGVGHEDDLTIADLVADVRALTPTDAATRVVPDRTEVLAWLDKLEGRLGQLLHRKLDQARTSLEALGQRGWFRRPLDRVREEERRLDDLAERLTRAAHQGMEKAEQRLQSVAARMESLSPLNVLARGYSLTRKEDGTVVRDPNQTARGQTLVTILQRGRIVSRVEEII